MTKTINLLTALVLTAGALTAGATGCEVIAKVDRNLVDAGKGGGTSASSSNTSSSSTGTGGTGGGPTCTTGMSCTTPGDCPASTTACTTNTCEGGCCGTKDAAAETACTDSSGSFCDGSGKCVACVMTSDCTAPATACKTNVCTGNACVAGTAAAEAKCTDNGGAVCDGAGNCVACLMTSDCAPQTTVCKINNCDTTAHTCGTTNAAKGTACTDNNGVVCDGNGTCVNVHCTDGVMDAGETDIDCGGTCGATCTDTPQQKCTGPQDCVSGVCAVNSGGTQLLCQPPTCSDGVKNGNETDKDCGGGAFGGSAACPKCADSFHCGINTDCTNNFCFTAGGVSTCLSCVDSAKDGNETDKDCGGPQCDPLGKTCAAGKNCTGNTDCASGFCQAGTCALRPDGQTCTVDTQCADGHCVGPAGNQICCNTACSGTCQACTMALTGMADGTCGNLTAGTTAPTGQCAVTTTCGNDGKCAAGGVCEQAPATKACGSMPGCLNGVLTTAGTCSGTGTCTGGGMAACAKGVICADTTSCKASCAADTDCEGAPGFYCKAGTCVAVGATGALCSLNDQCASNLCGTTNAGTHCCAPGTTCTAGGSCGTTDCNSSGACAYPTGACTATSCPSPGSILTTFSSCNAGACTGGSSTSMCTEFVCSGSADCDTECGTNDATSDAKCQSGWCDGMTTGTVHGSCEAPQAPGNTCTRNSQCTKTCCTAVGTGCTAAGICSM